jgi:hypothetical protein
MIGRLPEPRWPPAIGYSIVATSRENSGPSRAARKGWRRRGAYVGPMTQRVRQTARGRVAQISQQSRMVLCAEACPSRRSRARRVSHPRRGRQRMPRIRERRRRFGRRKSTLVRGTQAPLRARAILHSRSARRRDFRGGQRCRPPRASASPRPCDGALRPIHRQRRGSIAHHQGLRVRQAHSQPIGQFVPSVGRDWCRVHGRAVDEACAGLYVTIPTSSFIAASS